MNRLAENLKSEIANLRFFVVSASLCLGGFLLNADVAAADDQLHKLTFSVPIERSSWVAVRQFPQLPTNPIRVLVGDRPIRASRRSEQLR